jgi:prepilin-type N-terminal cleavage/methylation domain-containing protein
MHHKSGFTLLEMLIVLAIAGVLLGIASPSLLAYQTSTQMREVNNAVAQTLQDASSSALRSNTAYTVVFSLNSAGGSDLTVNSGGTTLQTVKLEGDGMITAVTSGGVALSPSEVVFTARGWPNLSAPIVISTQIRNRIGTIKLLLTGKAVIQ